MTTRSTVVMIGALAACGVALAVASAVDPDFWSSPDQRGDRLFRDGRYSEAAQEYRDPYRRGVALYRGGDFKGADAAFAAASSPEAAFDRGNSLLLLGKYDDAIKSYDRALSLRPQWAEAADNRALAAARRDRLKTTGGDETGGQVKADKTVFEKGKTPGEKTEAAGGDPLTDEQLRGLWLRRVQTKPADFLAEKFAYQIRQKKGAPQ
jgi:Ca-activated chloride channel family protein